MTDTSTVESQHAQRLEMCRGSSDLSELSPGARRILEDLCGTDGSSWSLESFIASIPFEVVLSAFLAPFLFIVLVALLVVWRMTACFLLWLKVKKFALKAQQLALMPINEDDKVNDDRLKPMVSKPGDSKA